MDGQTIYAPATDLDKGATVGTHSEALALDTALRDASGYLRAAGALAVSLAQIDLPELPDAPLSAPADRAILQAVAPLYLTMELESAGLLRALSAAAGLYMAGALRLSPSAAADTLRLHHRNYELRTPSDDRYAAYLRLFGTAPEGALPYAGEAAVNSGFEEAILALAEAMHRYAHLGPMDLAPMTAQREIRAAARRLGEALVMRGGGASHYLSEEALGLIATATGVFRETAVQRALGAQSLWGAVEAALDLQAGGVRRPRLLGALALRARAHLARGKSGMVLINWVAEEAQQLQGIGTMTIPRDAEILAQGTAWLEATLSLLSAQNSAYVGV